MKAGRISQQFSPTALDVARSISLQLARCGARCRPHPPQFAFRSTRRLAFLRQVVSVIPAVSMDINQCEPVIAEDTSVAVGAVGEIPKRDAVHLILFGIEGIEVSGCEQERRTALKDARNTCNCPNRVFGIQMEQDAPRNRSIEGPIGERARLNNSSNRKRFGAVLLKICKHRTRTI